MPPKRKSDVLLESADDAIATHDEDAPSAKQPRVGDATDAQRALREKVNNG